MFEHSLNPSGLNIETKMIFKKFIIGGQYSIFKQQFLYYLVLSSDARKES